MPMTQWIEVQVYAKDCDLTVCNVSLQMGKHYDPLVGRRDTSIRSDALEGQKIFAGGSTRISACGKDGSNSGTRGSFSLADDEGIVGTLSWDCSELFAKNRLKWRPATRRVSVDIDGGATSGAALGFIQMNCAPRKRAHKPVFNLGNLGLAGL